LYYFPYQGARHRARGAFLSLTWSLTDYLEVILNR